MTADWDSTAVADLDVGALLARLRTRRNGITVVVPVYNGGEIVERCLSSLVAHTVGARLLVIDDASPDSATADLLDTFAGRGEIELVRHQRNRGYSRTASEGLKLGGRDDVVLLNSDTVVGPMWLDRLRWTAHSQTGVGTVSAVSNDAAAMSLPRRHTSNSWYPRHPWEVTARLMARGMTVWSQPVPSAHGFCMYIRRALLDDIGGLDVAAFPMGYGEEVDFSQRAIAAGWTNLVAPHVMVKHLRSVSFGDRRVALNAASKPILQARYPDLRRHVMMWESSVGTARTEVAAARVRSGWRSGAPVERRLRVDPVADGVHKYRVIEGVGDRVLPSDWTGHGALVVTASQEGSLETAIAKMIVEHAVEGLELGLVGGQAPAALRSVAATLGGLDRRLAAATS